MKENGKVKIFGSPTNYKILENNIEKNLCGNEFLDATSKINSWKKNQQVELHKIKNLFSEDTNNRLQSQTMGLPSWFSW